MNSKNKVIFTLLLFFITMMVLLALDFLAEHEKLTKDRRVINESLFSLKSEIGFDGLIHNFKNAVLRPEEDQYRLQVFSNYERSMVYVRLIEQRGSLLLPAFTMTDTRKMLNTYKANAERLPALREQGLTIDKIDQIVRFDDRPAKQEILNISQSLLSYAENQVFNKIHRSFELALYLTIAIVISLFFIVKFFFKEQQAALTKAEKSNQALENNKSKLVTAQKALLSVLEDLEVKTRQTQTLNQQLSQTNKELEQFIYTVSHDLKSPLVTIVGFVQNLNNELKESLTEKQAHRFERVIHNAVNMQGLLTDLLEVSRIVQQPLQKTLLDTKDVIKGQLKLIEGQLLSSKTNIEFDNDLLPIFANQRFFEQCVLNLITNAIQYQHPKRSPVIKISTTSNRNTTSLQIEDNGKGIDKKYHDLIFKIFEKLDSDGGTGVGLAIVKTIMDKHNGNITIESTVNEGSRFSLTFPNENANLTSNS